MSLARSALDPPLEQYKPHVPALDVVAKRTQMDMLLNQTNAAPGLREQVYGLLDKIVSNPKNTEAYGELAFLQDRLSDTAEANRAREANPVPLTGHSRELAESILYEQLTYPHGHDEEAIAALRGALAVGEPVVQAVLQPPEQLPTPERQVPSYEDAAAEPSTFAVQNMAELANHR